MVGRNVAASKRHSVMVLALLALGAQPLRAQSMQRVESLLASDSIAAAAAAADDVLRDSATTAAQKATVASLFGRFTAADNADAARDLGPGTSAALTRLAAGAVPEALDVVEAELARQPGRASALRAITELGFGLRGTGAALRATTDDPGIMLLVYRAARDTAALRDAVRAIDSARARLALRNLPPPLSLAEAELALGDTAAALARLLAFDASWTRMERTVSWGAARNGWLLGRTWLLLGDVAAATGHGADAMRAYGRVIALWGRGDADVQPAVARARAALASTGAEPVDAEAARVSLVDARDGEPARVRYDAVLWMQPRPVADAPDRPLVRIGFVTTERAAGLTATQSYDSVTLDAPLLASLGTDGMAIRREIQSAAGRLTATTTCDALARVTGRRVSTEAALPAELRGLLEQGAGFGPLSMALRLPAGPVPVGASWTDTLAVGVPGSEGAVTMHATWRLARLASVGGRRLAFVTIDAATPAGAPVRATLTGEIVRDLDAGTNLRLAASLRAAVPAAGGSATPVRVLLTALREATAPTGALASR